MRYCLIISMVMISAPFLMGQSFSLEQAVEYGIRKNNQLDIDKLQIQDADAQIMEYWATGIPQLNGNVQYQHFVDIPVSLVPAQFFGGMPGEFAEVKFGTANRLEGSLELNALIFDGSFFVGIRAQKLFKELRKRELVQSEQEVRYNVTKAFLNALVASRNIEILSDNIENLQEDLAELKENYEQGFVEKVDVDRVRLSLSSLEAELESVEGNAWVAKNLLKFQMGYPINDTIILEGELESIFSEALVEKAQPGAEVNPENRPEYRIASKGLELNEVDVRRLRAGHLPRLTGFASHSQSLQRDDLFDNNETDWLPATIVGLNLSISIFDGLDRSAKIQRAKIAKEKTIKEINQLERSIRMEVENARIRYNAAKTKSINTKKNLEMAEEIFETARTKFNEGVGSSVEVRQAENDYYNAQSNYINAMYELLTAYADWQKAIGEI